MSGILGTSAPLTSDINLLFQIIIFIILLVGIKLGKTKTGESLKKHGNVMAAAVMLNALSILIVMIPSLYNSFSGLAMSPLSLATVSTAIHGFLGVIVEIVGIAFVLNKKPKNIRMGMRFLSVLWLIVLLMGFVLYLQVAGIIH